MKELERLFASDPDLARLHDVLERDAPPDGAIERATARVLATSAAEGASTDAGAVRPRPSFTPWIVVGIGAAVLVAGALARSPAKPTSGKGPEPLATAQPVAAPEPIASSAAAPPPMDAPSVQPSIRVDQLPAASPSVTARSPVASADPFLEELALVERARTALAQGRGRECLEAARKYEAKFGSGGLFREEVEVMHVEALAMSGERATARARGRRFLEAHPDTPYVDRIRRVLEQIAE